jgi:hypothetical protein
MRRSILGMVFFAAAVSQAMAGATSYFTETTKDFGTSPIGPVLTHYFAIKNTSANTVTMGTPRIGCGCVSATLMKPNLAPGETTYLIAYMDTKKIPNHQRSVNKTVTVSVPFLSPVAEEVVCRVTTVAREDLFFTPDSLRFGTLAIGAGGTATMKVTLFNQPNWQVTQSMSTGKYVTAEVKEASRKGSEVVYEVTATLNKECPIGNWMSEVILTTNASGIDKLRIPVSVLVNSPIAAEPVELKFGDVIVDKEAAPRQILLQSQTPFKVLEVKGTDGKISVKPVTDGSRATHILNVNVKAGEIGELLRKLEIMTDSKEMPMVIVPVSATAKK